MNILIIGKKHIFGEGGKGYQKSARKKNYFSLRFKDSICAKSKKVWIIHPPVWKRVPQIWR